MLIIFHYIYHQPAIKYNDDISPGVNLWMMLGMITSMLADEIYLLSTNPTYLVHNT